jgi:PadR family transcriptional regulator, regulatory protein PadR
MALQRITEPTLEVLRALLNSTEPAWGLRIVKSIGRRPGTVYPILARLEDAGWIEGSWENDSERAGPRRRLYVLSETGRVDAANLILTRESQRVPAAKLQPPREVAL